LIAAVKKVPKTGETIIDMDRGGTLARAKLGAREREAVRAIAKLLKKRKILFAAVDVIDGKITDFNHTSPGLLVPMEELLGENLAKKALAPILR
jgi:glutathione synthase/RimK-type ligase-like ATP-grasp enzyme